MASDDGACQDRDHDCHAGEVLDAAIAEGETGSRLLATKPECERKRYRGGSGCEIVNGVREQRDAPRDEDDQQLQRSCHGETCERPLDRPHSAFAGRDGGVDGAVRVAVLVWVHMIMWMIAHCRTPFE